MDYTNPVIIHGMKPYHMCVYVHTMSCHSECPEFPVVANLGGSNPFIWASWAFLEAKLGRVARARQLYDASVVAEPSHAAAWHGWGLLEKKEGNVLRARDLWLKVANFQLQSDKAPFHYR